MWYDTVFFACLDCSVGRETVVDGSGGEVGRKCSRIEYNGAGYYHTLNGYRTRDTFVYVHSVVWEAHMAPSRITMLCRTGKEIAPTML
jgi:hypothetical protein